jgi:excinuclease UvrABC nuclease subunit
MQLKQTILKTLKGNMIKSILSSIDTSFSKPTVDGILSSFGKMVTQLEQVAKENQTAADFSRATAARLERQAIEQVTEANRALKAADKIRDLTA